MSPKCVQPEWLPRKCNMRSSVPRLGLRSAGVGWEDIKRLVGLATTDLFFLKPSQRAWGYLNARPLERTDDVPSHSTRFLSLRSSQTFDAHFIR